MERSRETGIHQREIRVDRDKVADLVLSAREVTEVIETAVAGSKSGEYRVQGNSYRISVSLLLTPPPLRKTDPLSLTKTDPRYAHAGVSNLE